MTPEQWYEEAKRKSKHIKKSIMSVLFGNKVTSQENKLKEQSVKSRHDVDESKQWGLWTY